MERPNGDIQPRQRPITGEIVYLDEMRRQNQEPVAFLELGDMAIQAYEAAANMYPDGTRPEIIDEYEQYDSKPSRAIASCKALADELLRLKDPESPLTFVDLRLAISPDELLEKLKAISAGSILADDDAQLAIESDGSYYPVLDIRKRNASLVGTGLRAWGWDYEKYVFTNKKGEPYEYPKHALVYPSDEKNSPRQLELSFGYQDNDSQRFTESISLYINGDGTASISSNIWASAYAETGYEGHLGSSLRRVTSRDIAAFGDLVAEIVGDKPESVAMSIQNQLQELTDGAATAEGKQAVQDLMTATWPAQANYFLHKPLKGTRSTIAEQLSNESTVDAAIATIRSLIADWRSAIQ